MVHQLTEMTGFTEMTSEITGTTLKSTGMTLQIHKNRGYIILYVYVFQVIAS